MFVWLIFLSNPVFYCKQERNHRETTLSAQRRVPRHLQSAQQLEAETTLGQLEVNSIALRGGWSEWSGVVGFGDGLGWREMVGVQKMFRF